MDLQFAGRTRLRVSGYKLGGRRQYHDRCSGAGSALRVQARSSDGAELVKPEPATRDPWNRSARSRPVYPEFPLNPRTSRSNHPGRWRQPQRRCRLFHELWQVRVPADATRQLQPRHGPQLQILARLLLLCARWRPGSCIWWQMQHRQRLCPERRMLEPGRAGRQRLLMPGIHQE